MQFIYNTFSDFIPHHSKKIFGQKSSVFIIKVPSHYFNFHRKTKYHHTNESLSGWILIYLWQNKTIYLLHIYCDFWHFQHLCHMIKREVRKAIILFKTIHFERSFSQPVSKSLWQIFMTWRMHFWILCKKNGKWMSFVEIFIGANVAKIWTTKKKLKGVFI